LIVAMRRAVFMHMRFHRMFVAGTGGFGQAVDDVSGVNERHRRMRREHAKRIENDKERRQPSANIGTCFPHFNFLSGAKR
jgi:hypothetical protein